MPEFVVYCHYSVTLVTGEVKIIETIVATFYDQTLCLQYVDVQNKNNPWTRVFGVVGHPEVEKPY